MWLSPFTMLLRLHLDQVRGDISSEHLRTLLKTVTRESQILRSDASMTSLDSLILSLRDLGDWKASCRVFEFLDRCILRVVRKPVLYYDELADFIATAELDIDPRCCHVDLLLITILDQWRFLTKSADLPTITNVSIWLVRYIEMMELGNGYVESLPLRSETSMLLSLIRGRLKADVHDTSCRAMFEKTSGQKPKFETLKASVTENTISEAVKVSRHAGPSVETHLKPSETFLPSEPPQEHEDHPGLHRWTRHEVQDAISEGHIKELILCLCSKHVEIRKQALMGVRAFMMKLEVG